jgi:hypothetical protein
MAWEKRGGRRYFYAARRVGPRVVKTYFGRGKCADLASRIDVDDRRRRDLDAAALAVETARARAAEEAAALLETTVTLLIEATLLGAGYRRHPRGAWRRPRA